MTWFERINALIITFAGNQPSEVKAFGDAYTWTKGLGNFLPRNIVIKISGVIVYQKSDNCKIDFDPLLAINNLKAQAVRDEFLEVVYGELIALGF